jgi:ubiquinone/menaquinone biosynthesis C-methylase UbiE
MKRFLCAILLAALSGVLLSQGLTHPLTGRRIAGVAGDWAWLDRAEREQEEEPRRALELIDIRPGMVVADVGAGTGYFTVLLAQRVGLQGKVYANDIQPKLLGILRDKIQKGNLSNIEIVQGRHDDTRLPEGTIELALLVDVYHEFQYPQAMLASIRRSLKPSGLLVLLEYRKEDPDLPILEEHKMSVKEARTEVEAEGFTFDRSVRGLPRQHILIFRKPAQ